MNVVMRKSEKPHLQRRLPRPHMRKLTLLKGIADEARADAKDALEKLQTAQHELARTEADAPKAQGASSHALGSFPKRRRN